MKAMTSKTSAGRPLLTGAGQQGFSYLALLFAITVMGIALAVAAQVWSTAAQREREEELLFRGMEIRNAIGRYYQESPGAKTLPLSLEDLLKDGRQAAVKRYLRKIYSDPMTGKPDWELIKEPNGRVRGVRSRSEKEPRKKKNFPGELVGFEDRMKYGEWEFIYAPAPPVPAGAGGRDTRMSPP